MYLQLVSMVNTDQSQVSWKDKETGQKQTATGEDKDKILQDRTILLHYAEIYMVNS